MFLKQDVVSSPSLLDFDGEEEDSRYSSDEKQEYRKAVWTVFREHVLEDVCNVPEARVVLLPDKKGREIEVALSLGFPEDKLFCIDLSPGRILASVWRDRFPLIESLGMRLSRVGSRIRSRGHKVLAANLDLCTNFSGELLQEVGLFVEACLRPGALFAVTIQKGREDPAVLALMDALLEGKEMEGEERRLMAMIRCLPTFSYRRAPVLLKEGTYVSSRTPMVFGVFKIHSLFKESVSLLNSDRIRSSQNLVFEKGNWPGGRPAFGYKTCKREGRWDLVVDDVAAEQVRILFEEYAAGASLGDLRKAVQDCGGLVSGCGKSLGSSRDTIKKILQNSIYCGVLFWGKTRQSRNPSNGKIEKLQIPRGEWKERRDPSLRLVDDAVWDRVQERFEKNRLENLQILGSPRKISSGWRKRRREKERKRRRRERGRAVLKTLDGINSSGFMTKSMTEPMRQVLEKVKTHGGKLVRLRGNIWTVPGEELSPTSSKNGRKLLPAWWCQTVTVDGLVKRGVMRVSTRLYRASSLEGTILPEIAVEVSLV